MLRTFLNKIYILIIYFSSSFIEDLLSNTLSLAFVTCMPQGHQFVIALDGAYNRTAHENIYKGEKLKERKKRLDQGPVCSNLYKQ